MTAGTSSGCARRERQRRRRRRGCARRHRRAGRRTTAARSSTCSPKRRADPGVERLAVAAAVVAHHREVAQERASCAGRRCCGRASRARARPVATPGGPACSSTKRSATTAHARTLDPWSCSSSAMRSRSAIDEGSVDGPADPHLADLGRIQAEALADWLAEERVDALWCSPMRRARETAAPGGRAPRACAITFDDGPGRVRPRVAQLHPDRGAEGGRRPALARGARAARALQGASWWRRSSASSPPTRGQRVAVVCHGGVINAYAGHVLGIDDPLFFLPAYTTISRVLAATLRRAQHLDASTSTPTCVDL